MYPRANKFQQSSRPDYKEIVTQRHHKEEKMPLGLWQSKILEGGLPSISRTRCRREKRGWYWCWTASSKSGSRARCGATSLFGLPVQPCRSVSLPIGCARLRWCSHFLFVALTDLSACCPFVCVKNPGSQVGCPASAGLAAGERMGVRSPIDVHDLAKARSWSRAGFYWNAENVRFSFFFLKFKSVY